MATELAVGYISLVAETSKIPRQVRDMFDGPVSREADRAGKSMGDRMSSGIGKALKTGGVAAAAAGGAAIGTALTKGFQRLTAIDDAQGKLAGLGHSTQSTAKVMDSALASVKGTAFGLGDAATIAASAVAAGIKPGQDLTKYLSMTGDAATIAGTSLSDMGLIFNQVQTGQAAFTDDLNQLAGRGIPIYQWLGQEMHMTGAEVKEMASKGKISSEMFFKAIQKNIGGAAKESGKTVRGSFQNTIAALGRLGAAVEGPMFRRLPAFFGDITKRIDDVTPAATRMAEAFDAKVFDEWGPKVREAMQAFKDTGALDQMRGVFTGLGSALSGMGPSIGSIASTLAQASAALGVSGWQLFLTTLQASTTVLNMINPILSTTAGLMENNRGAVTALLAAWLAFKTVPSVIGRVSDAINPLSSRVQGASKSMRDLNLWTSTVMNTTAAGKVQMGQFGSSIAQIGSHVPVVARMQGSFVNAAVGAERFGRTAGVAAAAGTGLKAAGAGIAGVFGGPLGLAMAGAAVAGTAWAASVARQNEATNAYRSSLASLAEEQKRTGDLLIANRGAVNGDVYSSMSSQLDNLKDSLDGAGRASASMTDSFVSGITFGIKDQEKSVNDAARSSREAAGALDKLGLSSASLSQIVTGSAGAFDGVKGRLAGMGDGGQIAADKLQGLRDRFLEQQGIAQRVTPGIAEFGEALRVMGDKGSSSSDKLNALKAAMDAMNPARSKTEAIAQYGDSIRKVAESVAGVGPDAFKAGSLDAMSEAGATLSRTLADLADKSAQVASTGGDMAEVTKQNEQVFAALAQSTGQPIEKIRELYAEFGGKTVDLSVKLAGAPEAVKEMATVKAAFEASPDKKTISVETSQVTPQTVEALRRIGFVVNDQIPGGKTIEVTANDQASAKLAFVTQNVNIINALRANPTLDLNKAFFDMKDAEARGQLAQLDRTAVSPEAGLVIDKLLQGKQVSMQELQTLDQTTSNPKVDMLIDKIMQKIGVVNTGLDSAARPRTATITVNKYDPQGIMNGAQGGMQVGPPSNANGSIRQYLNGGIAAAEAYANGGTRLPDRALIQKPDPRGGLVQWAEPETGGEAFIPLAPGKRGRSTNILSAVAGMFGYALVPGQAFGGMLNLLQRGNYDGSLSRVGIQEDSPIVDFLYSRRAGQKDSPLTSARKDFAALASGARDLMKGRYNGALSDRFRVEEDNPLVAGVLGMRKLTRFADGGFRGARVTADAFRKLAEGTGAPRPLEGAPYVWGGTAWGDCSGAMSAFARLAAGLDPFGGRFATGNMAEAIKSMGGILGRGPSGSMRFGWFNGGPAGGHTAGTLPDGTNVEMGGGRGDGQLGGPAAGADDPQFTDHAYFPVEPAAPDWKDPGADSGGWVQRPDGTWVQTGPSGDYSSSGGSMGGGEDKSLSGRLGNVAKSFVSGQVASLFEVLSINDQPGWLAAISEYESQQQQKNSGKGPKLSKAERERLAAEHKGEKQKLKEDYDTEKLKRKQEYEAAKQKLENDYTLKKINKGDYERKLNDLKQKHDSDELKRKQEYDEKVAQAKAKYDSARGKTPGGADGKSGYESGALQSKQQYEDDQLALKQRHDNDKAARKAQYEREKKSLAAQRKSKSITKEQYEARSNDLKVKYDRDIAQMKTRYDDADLKRQQEYDRQKLSGQQSFTRQSAPSGVRDPGTRRPGAGQDLGSTGNPVKDAFRAGLRDGWRMGQPWTDTDFIINKESSWNPQARNGKYFGLIQAGPEVYQAAGKSPTTTNPTEQGQVYDRYVDERYQTPMAARKHHDAKNWYDSGGAAIGTGLMAKNVLEPERVLSPKQTVAFEQMVKRDFQSGGDARMIGLLEQMLVALRENPRGNVTYKLNDEKSLERAYKIERSRQRAQLAGK